jgi:lactate dehydrogenase-like 2-hydroxyacid dehydrogenase
MVWRIVPWWSATPGKLMCRKGIARCGAGCDNVDLEAAGKNGMYVCNVPDFGTEEVA